MNNIDVNSDTDDSQSSIQQQIRKIYSDTSLSQSEKSKIVFNILNPTTVSHSDQDYNQNNDQNKDDDGEI